MKRPEPAIRDSLGNATCKSGGAVMKGVGGGIRCPACGGTNTAVKDSRECHGGIRRRRLCLTCVPAPRFSTIEVPLDASLEHDKRASVVGALDALAKIGRMPKARQDIVMALIEAFSGEGQGT